MYVYKYYKCFILRVYVDDTVIHGQAPCEENICITAARQEQALF
jgi:hypothetical protein